MLPKSPSSCSNAIGDVWITTQHMCAIANEQTGFFAPSVNHERGVGWQWHYFAVLHWQNWREVKRERLAAQCEREKLQTCGVFARRRHGVCGDRLGGERDLTLFVARTQQSHFGSICFILRFLFLF